MFPRGKHVRQIYEVAGWAYISSDGAVLKDVWRSKYLLGVPLREEDNQLAGTVVAYGAIPSSFLFMPRYAKRKESNLIIACRHRSSKGPRLPSVRCHFILERGR